MPLAELVCLLIAAPLLMFPSRYSLVALALVPLAWLARLLARRASLRRSAADWPLAGLILMASVSLYPSVDLGLSRPKLYGLLLGFFVFSFIIEHLRGSRAMVMGTAGLTAGGLAVAAAGLVGSEWFPTKLPLLAPLYRRLPHLISAVPNSFGTTSAGFQPNEVAGTLTLLFPVALGVALFGRGRRLRTTVGLVGAIMLLTIVLTASRAALLGTSLAVLCVAIGRWPRLVLAVPGAVVALAGGIAVLGADRVFGWLLAMESATDVGAKAASRLEIWNRAYSMIQDFPFTGIGLNTFPVVVNLLYPLFLSGPDAYVPHAHNLFLQTAVDLGLPGLAGFLGLVTAAGLGLARAWPKSKGWSRGLVVGLAAGLVGHLGFGLIDAVTLGAKPGIFVWAVLGAAVALGLDAGASDPAHPTPACGAVKPEARKGTGALQWAQWALFCCACALGAIVQLTGMKMLPLVLAAQ